MRRFAAMQVLFRYQEGMRQCAQEGQRARNEGEICEFDFLVGSLSEG